MKVKELMTNDVMAASQDTSVNQIAQQMRDSGVGSIPICDNNGQAIGIVTDRDIVLRAVSQNNQNACAKEVMSKNIVAATPNMNAHEAAEIMGRNQVRRLPVIENSKLVGMIAMADIARKNIYVDEAGDALNSISKPNQLS